MVAVELSTLPRPLDLLRHGFLSTRPAAPWIAATSRPRGILPSRRARDSAHDPGSGHQGDRAIGFPREQTLEPGGQRSALRGVETRNVGGSGARAAQEWVPEIGERGEAGRDLDRI